MKTFVCSGLLCVMCFALASAQTAAPGAVAESSVSLWPYLVAAGLLGLVPGVSYVLILIEAWMFFSIAHSHHVDNTGEVVLWCAFAAAISALLKTAAHALHFAPGIGQIANSFFAMAFFAGLYYVADAHYAHLNRQGRHPDVILQAPQSPARQP